MLQNAPTEIDKFTQSIGDATSSIDTSDVSDAIDQNVAPGNKNGMRIVDRYHALLIYRLDTPLSIHPLNTPFQHTQLNIPS